MNKPDGGPAFPSTIPLEYVEAQGKQYANYEWAGMTRRQWYAGLVMQAIVSRGASVDANGNARRAWYYADALLAEEGK
jgi:hypothetical protein